MSETENNQPDVSKILEQHAELSTKRRVIDSYHVVEVFNRGRHRTYRRLLRRLRGEATYLQRLCDKHGEKIGHNQWEFDDKIEPFDDEKILRELGFSQYLD